MVKSYSSKFNTLNILSPLMIILYLLLGFVPNWGAVDKIAPQWLIMSFLNLLSVLFFIKNRKTLTTKLSLIIKSNLTLTYIAFFVWATGSLIYSINPVEVLVNLARQLNVFLMFFSMCVFIFELNNKMKFLSWLISIIIGIEIYSVLNEGLEMLSKSGIINSGQLKGVTANRNITAFSLAIKIPFILFLIHIENKRWLKLFLAFLIGLAMISLTIIQSRASFIAIGLIVFVYMILQTVIYFKENKKWEQLSKIFYLIGPLILAILINQTFLSNKGADAISRAATISISTKDGSVNQRLRYYEDVLIHMTSNPIFGVGLGNWKLKSIDYDSKDIEGYVVPYHAHSDFIQIGAELGIIGFVLYLGIFIWALVYFFRLIYYPDLQLNEKIFLTILFISLGVYSIDASLNFPIARPQVLVVWTLIISVLNIYYQKSQNKISEKKSSKKYNSIFLMTSLFFVLPSIYINNKVYDSLKGQMFLLQDFNSNQFNLTLNQVENIVPDIPNITVTTIPINSVKARYYVNLKKYDKALDLIEKGTNANPYLFYSEILKSQIYEEQGKLDSAKFYAKKAFYGLPNNDLHSSKYLNLISLTRDNVSLDDAFNLLTEKNKLINWKNYLVIASNLEPNSSQILKQRANKALEIFPLNGDIKRLHSKILIGDEAIKLSLELSTKGLEFFNKQDYYNAAIQFEKATMVNPLDYANYENASTANYMIGNLEKALDQIDKVINELNPLNGKCEYIKALIYLKMQDNLGACPYLEISDKSGFSQARGLLNQYCNFSN